MLSLVYQGLDTLEKYPSGGQAERLINVLFGAEPPSAAAPSTAVPAVGLGDGAGAQAAPSAISRLNDSQRDAVKFALATRDVALIHGPPGIKRTVNITKCRFCVALDPVVCSWRVPLLQTKL